MQSHNALQLIGKMWNPLSFQVPGMMTPTISIEEIDKKISELKAVEAWLTMNTGFVQMSVKTLEMQKAALEALTQRNPDTPPEGGVASKAGP